MNRTTKSRTRHIVTTGILGLALLSLIPLTAQAFGRGGKHRPDPDRAVARLTEKLELTAEQQGRVKAILEDGFAKRAEVREAHRSEMETLREQTHDQLAAALTPEQASKLEQLREERRGRMERRGDCAQRPERRNGGPGDDD